MSAVDASSSAAAAGGAGSAAAAASGAVSSTVAGLPPMSNIERDRALRNKPPVTGKRKARGPAAEVPRPSQETIKKRPKEFDGEPLESRRYNAR